MNPIKPACVFCRDNVPHERHLTLLEYARLFGEAESYARDMVLVQSSGHGVVKDSAKPWIGKPSRDVSLDNLMDSRRVNR